MTRPLAALALLLVAGVGSAEPVRVRFTEGLVHGFLALRTTDGTTVADGDLIQYARAGRVTARLVFRFKDGSLRDETAVFTQSGSFRLVSDHLVQKGPTFAQPLEAWIDRASGRVRVRYTDEDGKDKNVDEQMKLPEDLANGIILTLLKNVAPQAAPPTLSMVAFTPKPRVVRLAITRAANDTQHSSRALNRMGPHGGSACNRRAMTKLDISTCDIVAPQPCERFRQPPSTSFSRSPIASGTATPSCRTSAPGPASRSGWVRARCTDGSSGPSPTA